MGNDVAFESGHYRRALSSFATGVTVVTTIDSDGAPRGFTANSFTSVSLDPPLILVCLARASASYVAFAAARTFAVNILSEDQRDVSAVFASKGVDRFKSIVWTQKTTGAPILTAVSAWLDCHAFDIREAGDHVILIGRVVEYAYGSARPLGYCRGAYTSFAVAQEAIEVGEDRADLQFGAIVEHEHSILLDPVRATGNISLPLAARFGPSGDISSLAGQLRARGIDVDLAFPFDVVHCPDRNRHSVFYRGEAREVPLNQRSSFTPFRKIPWDKIKDCRVRALLQRYVFEREQDDIFI